MKTLASVKKIYFWFSFYKRVPDILLAFLPIALLLNWHPLIHKALKSLKGKEFELQVSSKL